jgi:hypothetical protein
MTTRRRYWATEALAHQDGGKIFSTERRHGHVSGDVCAKIVAAFRRHGVELLPETEHHGAGVRWRFPRAQRPRNWPRPARS